MSRTMIIRNRATAAIALTAAAALALTPVVAVATETAEASPEAISAETPEEGADTEPAQAVPPPQNNEFSLGQSLQIRVGPDAKPNSSLLDFRWSINQLTVQGEESGEQEVPVPDRGDLIRSLLDFSNPPQQDGLATLTADVRNGFGLARTVSLFPQDEEPPVALEASFTLDGEPIDAWDVVGKSGVLTATYTLTNLSTQTIPVEVENLAGEPVTQEVEADIPMVGIGKVLIPQTYSGLAIKGGTFGADGRGNNQVQFIALPFRPIAKDGTATFGWSANVENATIPSMLLQVAPVYIPMDDPETPEDESQQGGGGLGVPPPNLDPGVAQIQSGVQSLVAGLDTLANSGDGGDPLQDVEDRLNSFFAGLGANVGDIASSVDPDNPDSSVASINEAIAVIEQILPVLQQVADLAPNLKAFADALANPDSQLNQGLDFLGSQTFKLLCRAAETSGEVPEGTCAFVDQLVTTLRAINTNDLSALAGFLDGVTTTLIPTLETLNGILGGLREKLVALSADLDVIAEGLAEQNVSLPSLDAVISDVVESIVNSPGGQQVTGGLSEVSGGIDSVKSELGNYISQVVVALQGVGEQVSGTVSDVDSKVVTLKAEVGGMVMAAHQSPLPYGGDPQNAPKGTVLAGAYEFRVDAADKNQPNTGLRVLVGLVALIGAGALSYFVGRRKGAAGASATQPSEPETVGAAVGGTAVGGAAAGGTADAPADDAGGADESGGESPELGPDDSTDTQGDDRPETPA